MLVQQNREDQLQALKSNQLNMFYPDVQARGEYPTYMVRYFHDNGIKLEMEPRRCSNLKKKEQLITLRLVTICHT